MQPVELPEHLPDRAEEERQAQEVLLPVLRQQSEEKEVNELNLIEEERSKLVSEKRDIEAKLLAIKNLIRSSGRMSTDKYTETCHAQNGYMKRMAQIERQLGELKTRKGRLHFEHNGSNHRPKDPVSPDVIRSLSALRDEYQQFAADKSRVGSMRQMAAEFVLKLNPIIRGHINGGGQ